MWQHALDSVHSSSSRNCDHAPVKNPVRVLTVKWACMNKENRQLKIMANQPTIHIQRMCMAHLMNGPKPFWMPRSQ